MENPDQVGLPGRRERRRHETRERLYQSAMRLLSERDFDDVTIEMITESADVGKGTFFNYFPNKEAIVTYRFEQLFQLLTQTLGAGGQKSEIKAEEGEAEAVDAAFPLPCSSPDAISAWAALFPGAGPVWRRIAATMHYVGDSDTHSKRLARNLLALGLVNDAVRAASLNVHERVCDIAEKLIAEGQASGEIRGDFSSRILGDYLRGVYFNALYLWAESDDEEGFHAILDRILAFAWCSVRPEA